MQSRNLRWSSKCHDFPKPIFLFWKKVAYPLVFFRSVIDKASGICRYVAIL